MTIGVRTLVCVLDALAESNHDAQLCRLFGEAAHSQKAQQFLKPKTRQIIDNAKASS